MAQSTRDKILQDIIYKIIVYSSEKKSNGEKLLQYLTLLRNQRPEKNGKPSFIETTLRKRGATQALISFFNRLAQAGQVGKSDMGVSLDNIHKEILSKGLSVLGNAFAVDHEAVKEAEKLKFIYSLKIFLESKKYVANAEILSRVLKCLANLAVHHKLRSKILHEGIAILVISRLDEIYMKLTKNSEIVKPALIEEIIIEKDEEMIVSQASRAIRIFCSDYAFQQHLVRFGALLSVGRFLKFSYNQNLFSDILKAIAVLSCYVKRLPRETLDLLTETESTDKAVLQKMVVLLKSHYGVNKVAEPAIMCLTQLSENITLAKALVTFDVFEAALEAMKHSDDTTRLERLLRLFVALTKDSAAAIDGSLSHRLRLSCCISIGETVKILKNSDLKVFHYWLLNLYEKLSEDKLKDLVSRGIIGVLDKYLREEIGEYTMDTLRSKIAAMDNDACHVHTRDNKQCPFTPKYRCNSPTYRQFQEAEEEKRRESTASNMSAFLCSKDLDTSPPLSPSSIPAVPGSPGSPLYSPASSPGSSPQYTYSPGSPAVSDDEGIYSSSPSTSSSTTFNTDTTGSVNNDYSSEGESEDERGELQRKSDDGNSENVSSEEGPVPKKFKFDMDKEEKSETGNRDCSNVLLREERVTKEIRLRSNKIHLILGILSRCSHLTVLPHELTNFLPFLLEMLWNGRLSIENAVVGVKVDTPEEQVVIGRMCFQRAFKIVSRMCSDISVFPVLIKTDVIPIIYRILVYDLKSLSKNDRIQDFLNDYSTTIMDSLVGMSGLKNETSGWRQGYFLSQCCQGATHIKDKNSKSSHEAQLVYDDYTQAVLSIPLLYRQQCPIFRNFEERTKTWQVIFDLLTNIDDINVFQFQNCILALTCIAKTKGLKWLDAENASKRKLLYPDVPLPEDLAQEETVCFELDDGCKLNIPKKFLTQASPVFSAMFDGHFLEAGRQSVNIRKTSLSALNALVTQIYQQSLFYLSETEEKAQDNNSNDEKPNVTCDDYPLSTLFELLSLKSTKNPSNLGGSTNPTIIFRTTVI
ncbi:unnamed protein product [Allacma fusca]|uniref:BTB domain-containing protein n=1 Tax=Allacma fusca TaxID=39272 RepID=A0A8J2LPM7_9HEXA|nr:unnamed protein product [Allacma fusca]